MIGRKIASIGCLVAGVAVALGAFAAHGLKAQLTPYELSIVEKGVQYQFWHALALIGLGIWYHVAPKRSLAVASCFIGAGILCFSGSLYGLALLDWRWLWPITPLGGTCFLVGWGGAAWSLWRKA
ncbi:DUF423 domain-containing protein [Enterovibrio nigricans]|uniref:Uncharacterized membrane protein YgdD, TMEM256/DUF423 family n=1 Tax=Enterovibrio nigricans DSM 22720 TaxID=1121868 RepID=A0A1T4UBZ6_9GAMM|nr:DUF423 domain-containing protein [Enterovibrio nigricans]SKA50207.1 Uncharacterized membrane protein YgdD, TMEM256/DUF423 family [Enterovibrio nigricans DSM 22720]